MIDLLKTLDLAIVCSVAALLVAGSVVYVVKTLRCHDEDGRPAIGYGQMSVLPRKWQRWIMDERDEN